MGVTQERRVGIRGLNIGADAADLAEGALTIADGARFLELGSVSSKGGRTRVTLEYPLEAGFSADTSYVNTIDHMHSSPAYPRGLTPYYDQRVWPFDGSGNAVAIPQRLNFVYKARGDIHFNDEGSGYIFTGDPTFKDPATRAKFVCHGTDIYIADESTRPKIWRRKKAADQASGSRVKYDVRPMGLIWPTATAQVPTITTPNAGPGTLYSGVYRFKMQLENSMGDLSGTSVNVVVAVPGVAGQQTLSNATINLDWSGITGTFPTSVSAPTRVRLFASYTASYVAWAEPSEMKLWKTVAVATTSALFTEADFNKMTDGPPLAGRFDYPPILKDFTIAAGRSFGISTRDSVYRELLIGEGGARIAGGFFGRTDPNLVTRKWYDNSEIRKQELDESYVLWSDAGEYQYMPNWTQVGDGTETCVGLAALGASCVVFTNKGIYVIDPNEPSVRRTPSTVGAISRDSIVLTERGIRFVGTDGVPRLFNGATVDEVATELLPIFDRDDYMGPYLKFSRANKNEVVGTYGDRKFWMLYPVASASGIFKPGPTSDDEVARNMAIGDESRGPTLWSVDRHPTYRDIYWVGNESRLLAIDSNGYFYWLEEGAFQATPTGDENPYFEFATRKFSAGGVMAQFYCVLLDVDTQGDEVAMECAVQGPTMLTHEYAVRADGRQQLKFLLPSTFKGEYLDIRIYGSPAVRVTVFGIMVEATRRGEIS